MSAIKGAPSKLGEVLLDNQRYFVEGGQGNVESKRGCPKQCIYCADPEKFLAKKYCIIDDRF